MDYNELQTATAAEHLAAIIDDLKYDILNLTTEELAERGYIIEEYGRIIEELSNRKADEVLTIYYHDGLNYFEIVNN